VQRDIVPPFLAARKTIAMLAGHVHSYERFARDGKTFVVSGGGGGPRARLASLTRRRHADDLFAGPPLRALHFLSAAVSDEGVVFEMIALAAEGSFRALDRFALDFSRRVVGPAA
jgi:hypothetical protein